MQNVYGSGFRLELAMRVFGLTHSQDTRVGSAMMRGISGGERRRLTTAESMVGGKCLLVMDEISTGLDSAVTYQVVADLAKACHYTSRTILVSLLQPAPEVFNLFDDVILLAEGQLLFHGPREEILPFFASLGLECPVRKDPSTFLQEVTTPKGQLEVANGQLRAHLGMDRNPALQDHYKKHLMLPMQDINAAFWSSTRGVQLRRELDEQPFDRNKGGKALTKDEYALTWWESFLVLSKWQWLLVTRDPALLYGRILLVVVMAFIIGSLFRGLSATPIDGRSYFSIIFLSTFFLASGASLEMNTTFALKSVFFKQRDTHFYPSTVFSAVIAIIRSPLLLLEALFFCSITYFWIGFSPRASEFFTYLLLNFLTMMSMGSMYRFLAAACSDYVVATSVSGIMLLILVVTSGFAIIYRAIPPYWVWGYWISPLAYSVRGLAVNEMLSPHWSIPNLTGTPGDTLGIAALKSFSFQTERRWIWIGVAYNVAFNVVLTLATAVAFALTSAPKRRPVAPPEGVKGVKVDSIPRPSLRDMSLSVALKVVAAAKLPTSRNKFRVEHGLRQDLEAALVPEQVPLKEAGEAQGLPFEPITLIFRELRYFVPMPKAAKKSLPGNRRRDRLELLKGISAFVAPGVLTALMGGSGAGKTTLMDVIAGRKTVGEITGEILVNGYPKDQKTWSRVVGYVEQTDIHTGQVTIWESLLFSARLRLPTFVSLETTHSFITDVMEMVELEPLKDRLVFTLSLEQRKRLTIAVELVANPSVLFMDEPTSGLDARSASVVMKSVKNVSQNGRTVMVTIHQPSTEIFEAFDALLLMQRGGKLIYFGSLGLESCDLIGYFEAIPGVTAIAPGENPATWMLEVTGGTNITSRRQHGSHVEFDECYKESDLGRENNILGEELIAHCKAEKKPLSFAQEHATTSWTQFVVLFWKYWLAYWRAPTYNLSRMVLTLLLCLFYGSLYFGQGHIPKSGATIGNVQNVMGIIYSSVSYQGMFNLVTVMPVVASERLVLYRERAASMYGTFPYVMALGWVEVPYILAQTALFVPVAYFMVGFQANATSFFIYFFTFFLSTTLFTFFGQLLVYLTPSIALAGLFGGGINLMWTIFNGFMLPYPQFPIYWKWVNRLSPTTWTIYVLVVEQLGNNDTIMTTPSGQQQTVAAFVKNVFGYNYNFRGYGILILVAFVVLFRVSADITVRYVSWQRR
eukprot:jgi/Botrbrau1/5852/Bobra.0366s0033.1